MGVPVLSSWCPLLGTSGTPHPGGRQPVLASGPSHLGPDPLGGDVLPSRPRAPPGAAPAWGEGWACGRCLWLWGEALGAALPPPPQRPYDIHSSNAVESLVQLFSTASVQYVPSWSKEMVGLLRKVSPSARGGP